MGALPVGIDSEERHSYEDSINPFFLNVVLEQVTRSVMSKWREGWT